MSRYRGESKGIILSECTGRLMIGNQEPHRRPRVKTGDGSNNRMANPRQWMIE